MENMKKELKDTKESIRNRMLDLMRVPLGENSKDKRNNNDWKLCRN